MSFLEVILLLRVVLYTTDPLVVSFQFKYYYFFFVLCAVFLLLSLFSISTIFFASYIRFLAALL
jgi:hypothetical protein